MTVVRRQGIKNVVYTYLGMLLGMVSNLVVQPFFLSKEEIGITRLVITMGTMMASLSCLGVTAVIIRYYPFFKKAEKTKNAFFSVALFFPLFGFIICFFITTVFKNAIVSFYGENGFIITLYFWPILLLAFFTCMVYSFTAYCNALNKSSSATFVNEIINRAGYIIVMVLYAYGVFTQNGFIYSLGWIFFMQMLLLYVIINATNPPQASLSFISKNNHLKSMLLFGTVITFIQLTGVCLKYVDIVFVGKYLSLQELGVYSIAAFIGLVLETPLNALEKIAGPKIARLMADENWKEVHSIYKLSSKYLITACGLLGSVIVVCITPLLQLLPHDYSAGAIVTIIVCIGAFFNAATGVNHSIITYSNIYRFSALFYFLLLLLTIALNLFLIPRYGILGAAVATATASVVHNLLRFFIIKTKYGIQPFTTQTILMVAIIAVSATVPMLIQLDNKTLLIIVRGFVAATLFVSLIILTRTFTLQEIKNEISFFKKTFT